MIIFIILLIINLGLIPFNSYLLSLNIEQGDQIGMTINIVAIAINIMGSVFSIFNLID